ncbi:amidase [Clostridiaceae bacterium M8S5]|nr:amidase [Clostridiaceae bacterium M8S5]
MDYQQLLYKMKKVSKSIIKANDMIGKTVTYSRREILDEAVFALSKDPSIEPILFGVKDTNQINNEIVSKLKGNNGFLFHTIDKMSDRGRAIDIDNINPLTGRVMTGSSSCGCINILRGINDLAIGTDGGGSVLAPAISTGLYSIMAKGVGLKGCIEKQSTDNISFTPALGIISHNFDLCKRALTSIVDYDFKYCFNEKIKIAIPRKGDIQLPNKQDMNMLAKTVAENLKDYVEVEELPFIDFDDRNEAIRMCNEIFNKDIDIILTVEGPIDLYGLGDSVIGTNGLIGKREQRLGGKYIIKVANMVEATTITLPYGELAMGVVITAKNGISGAKKALFLASKLKEIYKPNDLYERYFINSNSQEVKGFI